MMYLLLVTGLGLLCAVNGWMLKVDSHQAECLGESAARGDKVGLVFQVVDGGFLDVDVKVKGPDGKELYSGVRETSGKFAFNAYLDGRYEFCFSNELSSMTPKIVMFDVMAGPMSQWTASVPSNVTSSTLQRMVGELGERLVGVQHEQDYLLVRTNLHRNTSEHINTTVAWWAAFELLVIVVGVLFELFYIKRFFEIRRVV